MKSPGDDGAETTTREQKKKVIRRGNQANSLTRNTADTFKNYTGKDANLSMQIGKIREEQNKGLQKLKKGGKVS